LLDDTEFISDLAFDDLQNEYRIKKKEILKLVDKDFEKSKEDRISKKIEGIQQDQYHRKVLNACILPFSHEGPLADLGYYFYRASPLSELDSTLNLDFLLLHPKPPTLAIFGEAKGQLNDPDRIVDETKKRIKVVYENLPYLQDNYFKFKGELEFVIGVWASYGNEIAKIVERKQGGIKVWSTGPQLDSTKSELYLVRPPAGRNPNAQTMFHMDQLLNQNLSAHIETVFEYKTIFPQSHIFAKLSLLALIREENDHLNSRIFLKL
jgi:hypothetical protein